MSAEVTLRPMLPAEFDAYMQARDHDYVRALSVDMSPEAARQKAAAERRRFLPQGLETEGHRLLLAEDAEGQVVGQLWLGLTDPVSGSPATAWLFHLHVEPTRRRLGFGTAMLAAVESLLRELGMDRLGLSVDDTNAAARALYESAGYAVATRQMSKRLHDAPRGT